jgi:flagellar basal body-associated protein FliL
MKIKNNYWLKQNKNLEYGILNPEGSSKLKNKISKFYILTSKFILLGFSIAIILGFTLNFNKLSALDVIQTPDILDVKEPGPNAKIRGSVNIVWRMFDNSQSVIPYTIKLYDAATCNSTNFGQINSNTNGTSSQTQDNIVTWNTRITSTTSNLADGNYCIKICASLKDSANKDYSACNGRNIMVLNNNRLPSITSTPSNLTIFEDQSFTYDVEAGDPDGDTLSFRFVMKPAFLDINSSTGLITSNGTRKIPENSDTAIYTVRVAVDDGKSGEVTQQFDLTVKKRPPVNPPTQPTEPIQNYPTEIKILAPVSDTIFDTQEALLKWDVKDQNGIHSIKLRYSKDAKNWIDIIEFTDPTIPSEYAWNIVDITGGDYLIELVVTDKLDTVVSKTSPKFKIEIETDEPPIDSNPVIIDEIPANNSEIEDKRPSISAKFTPPQGAEIDPETFKINLDDVDIKDLCVIDEETFNCILNEDLSLGIHKVTVEISDSNSKTGMKEWSFTIISSSTQPDGSENSDVVNILGRDIPRNTFIIIAIILCLVLLLLLIPWIIYSIWSRRHRDEQTTTTDTNSIIYNQDPLPTLDTNYTYYVPPTDTTIYPTSNTTTNTSVTPITPDVNVNIPAAENVPAITTSYYIPDMYPTPDINTNYGANTQQSSSNDLPQYPNLSSDFQTSNTTTSISDQTTQTNSIEDQSQKPEDGQKTESTSTTTTTSNTSGYIEPKPTD